MAESDGVLLRRFVEKRDELAFKSIVEFHGQMVMGVARRILRNQHDAEDVFQATFLVLAQKAKSLRNREALAGWLYRVAYNLALKHYRKIKEQRQMEVGVPAAVENAKASDAWEDVSPVLDAELGSMSAKLREPIICCYIEGMKREQAAEYLGLAPATLGRRLEQGRGVLRRKLLRRGLRLSGVVLSGLIGGNAQAGVSATCLTETCSMASAVHLAAGGGTLSGGSNAVQSLAKEGVRMLLWMKAKTVATVVLAVTVGAGAAYIASELVKGDRRTGGENTVRAAVQSHVPSRAPLYDYMPYDGEKRYTMEKGYDTPKRFQNLVTAQKRYGYKPYRKLWQGKNWQSERMVFHDTTTGAKIVRLTNDYGSDYLDYHKGAWSANGKYIVWRRKPGMWESSTETNGPTCVNSDGTNMRPVFRDATGSKIVRKHQCDRNSPDICYSMVGDKKLCAFSLSTGKCLRTLGTPGGSWHLKSSIDGKYLLSSARKDGKRFLWVIPVDAKDEKDGNARTHWISLKKAYHDSFYIHPTEPYVMFWYEGDYRTEGFSQKKFDNTDEHATGITFDWNHGDFGDGRCVHEGGSVYHYKGIKWTKSRKSSYARNSTEEYYDLPHDYNGYSSFMPKDGDWAVGSRLTYRPYISELLMHSVEPVESDRINRFRICMIGNHRGGSLDAVDGSPDGTKFLFNSDMFDANQIFYVVARNPEPPVALTVQGKKLSWKPAKHHKETRGYIVYGAKTSGGPYRQLSGVIDGTSYSGEKVIDKACYVVTAVEHSGLESGYSNEARSKWAGKPVRVFAEAESGTWNRIIWKCLSDTASDLHYVWHREKDSAGELTVRANLPHEGNYYLWARVKGNGIWKVGEQQIAASQKEWKWVKAPSSLDLRKGRNEITFSSSDYGIAIDDIWLASDRGFTPRGKGIADESPPSPVQGLAVTADSEFHAQLKWQEIVAKDIAHYNIYIGENAGFTCDRTTLIASPVSNEYLDWQLSPGKKYYYRVSAVDRQGNESTPSEEVQVVTARQKLVKHEVAIQPGKEISFDVPTDGKYCLWLKMNPVASARSGYLEVVFDDTKHTWTPRYNSKVANNKTVWLSYGQFGVFDLKAGAHTFKATSKTVKFDRMILTNDLSWKPEGYTRTGCAW